MACCEENNAHFKQNMAVAAATSTVSSNVEDEEQYLYGETGKTDQESEKNDNVKNGDDEGEFEESDDDDDDDNIQVHIGEVNTSTSGAYGTPGSWKKDGATAAATAAAAATKPGAVTAASIAAGQKKIDVNAVGLINGQPIYEFDIDSEVDEKPWRKPGADISDYFNYGFTEDTWKQYCEKQRRMRLESNRGPYTVTQTAVPVATPVEIEVLPDGRTRVKAGPPPDRKVEGSIHVLGSDDLRRKQKEDELLALALGQQRVMPPANMMPGQPQMFTALPNGQLVPINLPTSNADGTSNEPPSSQSQQPTQQIQTIGAPTMMNNVGGMSGGIQYLPPNQQMQGMRPPPMGPPGGPQVFPPPPGMDMQFPPPDPFLHPGMPPPGFGPPIGPSDEDFDSDSENRRHRSSRRSDGSSRHKRHRDRGDRDSRSDRDRSRRDRDRSESRSRRDHSKSDRKKHSSRSSSSIKQEDDDDRKSRSSSRRSSKHSTNESSNPAPSTNEGEKDEKQNADVKQEPTAE